MDEAMQAYRAAGDAMVAADRAARHAQVARLASVLDFLDACPAPDPLPTPAAERLVGSGSRGTEETGEFVALDVAALLGLSRPKAWSLVHDAADMRARMPLLWEAFRGLEIEEWAARQVVRECSELDADAAGWVDGKLAGVWGTAPWARIMRRLEGLVVRADRELAARKAESALANRFVAFRHLGDGTTAIAAQLDTAAALTLASAIDSIVDQFIHEGASGSRMELRARALEMMATPQNPGAAGAAVPGSQLPLADVVVHIAAESLSPGATGTGVGRMVTREGGTVPVLTEQIAGLLGHHRVRVMPVIDLAGDPGVDSYEIPDRIRRRLGIREGYSVFPFSTSRSRGCDVDHTIPFRRGAPGSPAPPGQTRISNLGPLARGEHRAKTAGAWRLDQPVPGLYIWTDRVGHRWAVIGGHTHRLPDGTASRRPANGIIMSGAPAPVPHPSWYPRADVTFA